MTVNTSSLRLLLNLKQADGKLVPMQPDMKDDRWPEPLESDKIQRMFNCTIVHSVNAHLDLVHMPSSGLDFTVSLGLHH